MIEQLNVERNTPLAVWDADERPEAEKGAHPWAPTDCSILELATTGSCAKKPEPFPTDDQLRAVRERLFAKGYDRLRAQLEKGWVKSGGLGSAGAFPGAIHC